MNGLAGHVALVVTAAPLARRTRRTYDVLWQAGWRVTVCLTAAATEWVDDVPTAALLAGRIRPAAAICCPATFNPLNKWAGGLNDSAALGILNDAVGLATPTLVVPMVAERLSRHPAWPSTLAFLNSTGVLVLDPEDGRLTTQPRALDSGTGDGIAESFDAGWLVRWLEHIGRGVDEQERDP